MTADEAGGDAARRPVGPIDSREAFRAALAGREAPAVARVAFRLDVDADPLTAYAALSDRSDYGFLLESADKTPSSDPQGAFAAGDGADRHARYSFVGYDPEAVVRVTTGEATVDHLGGPAGARVAAALSGEGDGDSDASGGAGRDGDPDTLDALRGALPAVDRVGFPDTDRQTLQGGLVGFLAYDAVYDLWLDEVGVDRPETPLPDAEFVLTTRTLAFDHGVDDLALVCTPLVEPDDDPDAVYDRLTAEADDVAATLAGADAPATRGFRRTGESAGSRDDYEAAVRRIKGHVRDGDVYQGVVSRSRRVRGDVDPVGLYGALRSVNPSPYMYLLRHGSREVVGASPETLVSVRDDRVTVNPIAGTCPRGTSPVEDRRLAGEMLADDKERAEHTMLVDLARNDVRRVSTPGSVRVEEFMSVLKYSHVQHIESTVTGRLRPDADAFDATRATFPAGTLTGAPKIRAMELIDAVEAEPRGAYGGGVGYYSWTGDADVAIVIRTATLERVGADGAAAGHEAEGEGEGEGEVEVTVRAGAGVVADSDPGSEFDETERKMGGVLDAIARLERVGPGADGADPDPDPDDEPEDAGRPASGPEARR